MFRQLAVISLRGVTQCTSKTISLRRSPKLDFIQVIRTVEKDSRRAHYSSSSDVKKETSVKLPSLLDFPHCRAYLTHIVLNAESAQSLAPKWATILTEITNTLPAEEPPDVDLVRVWQHNPNELNLDSLEPSEKLSQPCAPEDERENAAEPEAPPPVRHRPLRVEGVRGSGPA